MLLADLLDMSELKTLMESRHIIRRDHPTLPLAILNYSNECMFEDFWPETVQHCRGLIVETEHVSKDIVPESTVIARPFHKFFNLNHSNQLDYHEGNLPKVVPTVTEKMDGWFGILWRFNGEYGIASRGSFDSPGARFGTDKLRKLIKYGAIHEFPEGYTPIFEIIFKEGKVVVDYPFEGLVLLGLINNETGEELPYDELFKVWSKILTYSQDQKPWIRLVKAHNMSVEECQNSDKKNFEGFVLSYTRQGTYPIKVKVKLEDYKRLHKLITGITPQQIWKALHDPMAPWMIEGTPDHFRKWAINWRDNLYYQFNERLRVAQSVLDEYQKTVPYKCCAGTGEFRKHLVSGLKFQNAEAASIALAIADGKIYEAYQMIWKGIRPVGRESETFYREGAGE